MKIKFKLTLIIIFFNFLLGTNVFSADKNELLKQDWSFKSFFGTFDRASLQRGYQVYAEVCSSCHSMKYISLSRASSALDSNCPYTI